MTLGRTVSVVLILVASIVLGWAAPAAAGMATQTGNDGFEPNDDFESATSIDEGDVSATIVDGESDFYRIEGNSTDAIDVEVTPASGPIEVRVYDADRNLLAEERNAVCCPGSVRATLEASETGNYYVEVAGRADGTTTEYQLQSNRTGAFVDPGPPPVAGGSTPNDPDGDGVYEDVNGDGDVTPGDATVLFNAVFDRNPAVTDNVASFDFNGDGDLTPGDATVLFGEVFG